MLPGRRAVESFLCTLAPRMLAFRGVGAITEPVDSIEEVDALRLLKLRLC